MNKKQKNTVNNFLKDAEEMQPMFLQKSVEKKLLSLYGTLYEGGVKPGQAGEQKATGRKLQLVQELEQLERDYNGKKIPLRSYSDKLQALQLKVSKL